MCVRIAVFPLNNITSDTFIRNLIEGKCRYGNYENEMVKDVFNEPMQWDSGSIYHAMRAEEGCSDRYCEVNVVFHEEDPVKSEITEVEDINFWDNIVKVKDRQCCCRDK